MTLIRWIWAILIGAWMLAVVIAPEGTFGMLAKRKYILGLFIGVVLALLIFTWVYTLEWWNRRNQPKKDTKEQKRRANLGY